MLLNILFLILAITAETTGDASIRLGVRGGKLLIFLAGAGLVICYGTLMSFPSWNFSRTMGVYIALFFIISQIVAVVIMRERISVPVMVGGLLIVAGGLVILLWEPKLK